MLGLNLFKTFASNGIAYPIQGVPGPVGLYPVGQVSYPQVATVFSPLAPNFYQMPNAVEASPSSSQSSDSAVPEEKIPTYADIEKGLYLGNLSKADLDKYSFVNSKLDSAKLTLNLTKFLKNANLFNTFILCAMCLANSDFPGTGVFIIGFLIVQAMVKSFEDAMLNLIIKSKVEIGTFLLLYLFFLLSTVITSILLLCCLMTSVRKYLMTSIGNLENQIKTILENFKSKPSADKNNRSLKSRASASSPASASSNRSTDEITTANNKPK